MQAILVHGLIGQPDNHWFPWLMGELEKRGVRTQSLKLPKPVTPHCAEWVATLAQAVEKPSETILIGHSLGCATILHYLQDFSGAEIFPHVVLVAGFGRSFLNPRVSKLQARLLHWFENDLDYARIRGKARRFTCINSTNDPLVPYAEGVWLAEQLGAKLVTEKKQHFLSVRGRGVVQLPSVLEALDLAQATSN